TLSLLIPFWSELLDVTGVSTKVNYGLDKVRFTNPVKVGSRIRMHAEVAEVKEVKGNGLHLVTHATTEIEGEERPAVVATFLSLFHDEESKALQVPVHTIFVVATGSFYLACSICDVDYKFGARSLPLQGLIVDGVCQLMNNSLKKWHD